MVLLNADCMPRLFFVLLNTLTFLLANRVANGQTQSIESPFPTYKQIKPAYAETVDCVYPVGTHLLRTNATLNRFDYPKDSVTYVLNGKPTTDVDYVKRVLAKPGTRMEAISIGEPDAHGRRIIAIKYEPL